MTTWLAIAASLLAAGIVVYLAGPRVSIDTTIRFNPDVIGDDPESWLERTESRYSDIRPGLHKQIIWADPVGRARTPLCIIYIHGFSASLGEVRPLPDHVAGALQANLFYTRLTGHGRSEKAMGEASVNAWVNDYAEAIAIGERLGEKIIVIATSTGATLATWAASQPALSRNTAAFVMISANYGVQASGAGLLAGPWGAQLAHWLVGPENGFEPHNEQHAALWTTRYPTTALLPMAGLVKLAAGIRVEDIRSPALFLYSAKDSIIRPDLVETMAHRWGGHAALVDIGATADPSNHVIAGDALSPETTDRAGKTILGFIRALDGAPR